MLTQGSLQSPAGVRTPERSNFSVREMARTKSPVEGRGRGTPTHSSQGGSVRSRSPSMVSSISEHMAKQRSRRNMGGSSVAGSSIAGSTVTGSTASRPSSTVSTPPRLQSRETSRPTSRATSRTRTEGSDLSPSEVPGTRDWYLEMRDPPQTATYARGPFESNDLVERLGLNNGEVVLFSFWHERRALRLMALPLGVQTRRVSPHLSEVDWIC